jgi:hypothetical protein
MNVTLERKPTATQENAMGRLKTTSRSERAESGFALVLAILALMLLTFLGLTLATTTSTELQIATNYRWSQQALYNAEAGVEYGKSLLAGLNWQQILPDARPTSWTGGVTPAAKGGGATEPYLRNDKWGVPARNFESWSCDKRANGMGYGVVLDDGANADLPLQDVTSILGQNLNGSVTVWIRRPVLPRAVPPAGEEPFADYGADDDNLVLVAEGVAPQRTVLGINRAVRLIEVMLSRVSDDAGRCGTRGGQVGGGPEGAGFGGCDPVTGAGVSQGLGTTATELDASAK